MSGHVGCGAAWYQHLFLLGFGGCGLMGLVHCAEIRPRGCDAEGTAQSLCTTAWLVPGAWAPLGTEVCTAR